MTLLLMFGRIVRSVALLIAWFPPPTNINPPALPVSALMKDGNSHWNIDLIWDLFDEETCDAILKVLIGFFL